MELDNRQKPSQDGESQEPKTKDQVLADCRESMVDTKDTLDQLLVHLHKVETTAEKFFEALGVFDPDNFTENTPEHVLDIYSAINSAEEAMGYLNRAMELSKLLPDSSSQDTSSTPS